MNTKYLTVQVPHRFLAKFLIKHIIYFQDLLNFDDPLNVEASELYFKNKVRNI